MDTDIDTWTNGRPSVADILEYISMKESFVFRFKFQLSLL